MESSDPLASLPPASQPTKGDALTSKPTLQWKIWARCINKNGDWHCTHRFEDGTETYHYVNEDGSVYLKHRDGSATYCPYEGMYKPSKERQSNSTIPAPTKEDIIEGFKEVKREHQEYLASPVNYWDGVRTTPRGNFNIAWLFPSCDCADGHYSVLDDYFFGYSEYDDLDYGYEPSHEEYEAYGLNDGDEEEDYTDGDQSSNDGDEEEDYIDDDQSSSTDEYEPTTIQEDDKTTVRISDVTHLPSVDVKPEIKEEAPGGPTPAHIPILKPEAEEISRSSFVSDPTPSKSGATESGATGEQASRGSMVGPDVQTEGKRILRSHRSKPY